MQQLAEMP